MNTHKIIPLADLAKQHGEWNGVHDEIIDRISGLSIDCPECETIIHSDEQYQCGTCNGGARIDVLEWFKSLGKGIALGEADIKDKALQAFPILPGRVIRTTSDKGEVTYPTMYDGQGYQREGYTQALKDLL